jgi:hypothetical protein
VREHAGELAGILAEPCMANSGVIPPLPGWNERLRRLCDDYGLVLIFDEVITGFRMALGGCQELYGVDADSPPGARPSAAVSRARPPSVARRRSWTWRHVPRCFTAERTPPTQ